MSTQLLQTKLYIPPLRPNLVPRPRLLRKLDEGLRLGYRLILISTPPGFGKTALLSEWVHSLRTQRATALQVAWLSLDEGDNDPTRFLAYFVAALQPFAPGRIEESEAYIGAEMPRLRPPQPPIETVLTALINKIAASSAPGEPPSRLQVIVLDDYHLITAQPIHDALTFLLDHLPPQMHLVIATRADPPLPLARLRARGQLLELRAADLRFTFQECASFLGQVMGLNLSAANIAALEARTEGWIAGLQVAALSMREQKDLTGFVNAFTGSHRYILDYLVEEVLHRQPESIQSFLLNTSILDRLSAPLCDAVMGSPMEPMDRLAHLSGKEILEYLERNNLFVVPLDDERRWYRYHRLFADLLRQRLHQEHRDRVSVLHRRASAWFEQNGLPAEAIDHSIAAGDLERAADLIAQNAEATLMRGEVATFLRWTEALPDELVRAHPTLCLFQAWIYILSGQPLEVIEARLQAAESSGATVPGGMTALRALIAAFQGQVARTAELSQRALEQLSEEERFLRGVVTWLLNASRLASDLDADDSQAFAEVLSMSRRAGNVMVAIMVECDRAEWLMRRGQLHRAAMAYTHALDLATDEQGRRLPLAGQALVGLGELAREWNDLDTAARYLQEGIRLSEQWTEVGPLEAYISLARVRQAQGDETGALEAIRKAEELALRFDFTELDDLVVDLFQAWLWIVQGDLAAVRRWAEKRDLYQYIDSPLQERADDPYEHRLRKYELLILARLLIAEGRPGEASKLLKPLVPIAEWRGRPGMLIEIHILQALAAQALGNTQQAMTSLQRALSLAEAEGYTRLFLDEGAPMVQLLRELVKRDATATYAHKLLAALGPEAQEDREQKVAASLVEPLSARELEILRLLRTHLTSTEMAEELCISVNTVRYHIKNIYGKLGVHSRSEAVQRAEALGLL
ncbi:MAG: tetratricopeptide repeat protein [Anaerolineae bacterium]|nr:tetratricopeptide repeat protein [Anaerolineae bacterium]